MDQTASIDRRSSEVPRFVDRVVRPMTRILNPLIMRVAGGRWFPMFSLLWHRGHRSGRVYMTPISAMPRGGWFWLALTFGQDSGWARNVIAAGGCDVRYRGTDYRLGEAAIVDAADVRLELPPAMRYGMAMMGVQKVLRMRSIVRA